MSPRSGLIIGSLSFLLIGSLLGFYVYGHFFSKANFAPKGALLLSLALKGSSEVNLYEFDLKTKELKRLGQNGNSNYDARIAPDGNRIAHVAYGSRALASQVVIYDPISGERRSVTRGEAFRHSPDWSPVGSSLAFSQDTKSGSDVYVVDFPDAPRALGAGAYPVWSFDGKSVFAIDQTGLIRYDLAKGGASSLVWGAKGRGMKLSASADHSLLAWLIPGAEKLMLFKANPANSKELILNSALVVRAYDAVFSPDNVYVAYRVFTGEGDNAHFEIIIERLDTGERKTALDLSSYEKNTLYLSAWTWK